jgi:hypothetical protein
MPAFLRDALRTYPYGSVLVLVAAAALLWYWLTPSKPVRAASDAKPAPIAALPVKKDVDAAQMLAEQRTTEEMKRRVLEQEAQIRKLQGALETLAKTSKEQATAQQEEWKAALGRLAQEQAKRQAPPAAKPVQAAAPTPKPSPPPAPPALPALREVHLSMLRGDGKDVYTGPAPRQGGAYLPAASFADIRIVTGALASSRAHASLPVLVAVTSPFHPPYKLLGPGQNPVPTQVPLQGCFALGRGAGDLAAGRIIIEMDLLSCVMPDGSAYEPPIQGYIVDIDMAYGMVGEILRHDSAVVARAFLTSVFQEASAAFVLARSNLVVTPVAGGQQPFQGAQSGMQKLVDFYLQQAEFLLPTISLKAGAAGRMVLKEGLMLEQLPTTILVAKGQS